MPTIFPGAIWRPMPGQEKRAKRHKGRGVGFHVAVYGGPSIYDINLRTGNDAHLYVRYDGTVEQNVDLDLQAWAGAAGNGSMIWVETAGGTNAKTVNTEVWTPAQAATLARIARWAHDTEGVPLQVMPDSKPASRGIGTHRLGIQHSRGVGVVPGWLIAGGEKWSSVLGKECPGNAKIAQLPAIIAAAQNGGTPLEDDMPLTDDDIRRIWEHPINSGKRVTSAEVMLATADSFAYDAVPAIVNAILDAPVDRPDGRGPTSLRGMVGWNDNHVDALASGIAAAVSSVQAGSITGPVDPAAVRKAVQDAVNNLDVKISAS